MATTCMDCGTKSGFCRSVEDIERLLETPREQLPAARCSSCERLGEAERQRRREAQELLEAKALVAMSELDAMEKRGESLPPPPPPTEWEGTEGYAKRWADA